MQCDMCGADKPLVDAIIEEVSMKVCRDCAKYGKIVQTKHQSIRRLQQNKPDLTEMTESIVDNYHTLIKNAREAKNMKQEELAKIISEKESVIHKMESKHFEPSIRLAKKLERILGIKLIEKVETLKIETEKRKDGTVTLGDVIKIKKNRSSEHS